jgi:hypothetical protein
MFKVDEEFGFEKIAAADDCQNFRKLWPENLEIRSSLTYWSGARAWIRDRRFQIENA